MPAPAVIVNVFGKVEGFLTGWGPTRNPEGPPDSITAGTAGTAGKAGTAGTAGKYSELHRCDREVGESGASCRLVRSCPAGGGSRIGLQMVTEPYTFSVLKL
jgi:hypothetical protein